MSVLEALFGHTAGGAIFFLPVWLIAIALAAYACGYNMGWLPGPGGAKPSAYP